jgi:replicative DNA helicase
VILKTLFESVEVAFETLHILDAGTSSLIPLGVPPLDRVLGGLFPGTCGILAAQTGVGKSSAVLSWALAANTNVGIISTEDTPDLIGSRILSAVTGIDSLKFRRGDLTDAERRLAKNAKEELKARNNVRIAYCISGSLIDIQEAVRQLAIEGSKVIWLDYIQKIRGHNNDRRNEVSTSYTTFQRECAKNNVVGMVVSQFRRLKDTETVPQIWMLKESGDLENEARLCILAHRDEDDRSLIHFRIAKSTFGGENLRFCYRMDSSGTLQEIVIDEGF